MPRADEVGSPALRAVPRTGAEAIEPPPEGDRPPLSGEDCIAARIRHADRYLNEHLKKQLAWYGKKASAHKHWSQWLGLAIIACGALITFVQAFAGALPLVVPGVTAALGVIIALLTGIQRIWKFDESWISYRRASEQMKREYRLYINEAGPYRAMTDEGEAYRRFVENAEAIIAEEQQLYWSSRAAGRKDSDGDKPKPAAALGSGPA
jgi:Protein of unknown function (DUF4231)